jgi:AmmeMemoRadiSam system protein B
MKKKLILSVLVLLSVVSSCKHQIQNEELKNRQVVDTIGFAQYDWQMDSIISRLSQENKSAHKWRVAISPHDDYAYVGNLYPKVLSGIKAKTVILFGVAHKASSFNLENQIIFDSFDQWAAPYGNIKVSDLRNEIIAKLPDSLLVISDEMQSVEHSLEALIPFLQSAKSELEIIPVLVPYMSFEKMQQIAKHFTKALSGVMKRNKLIWGDDIAILISTDAVHYGDEDWGGNNYAPYGTDSLNIVEVKNIELEIINNCLVGEVSPVKIQKFIDYTVQEDDYKEYKWTWCGRYSVPFGLLTAYYLNDLSDNSILKGDFIGYATSIDYAKIEVNDLRMGTTAPANNHHFVGYAAIGYK